MIVVCIKSKVFPVGVVHYLRSDSNAPVIRWTYYVHEAYNFDSINAARIFKNKLSTNSEYVNWEFKIARFELIEEREVGIESEEKRIITV